MKIVSGSLWGRWRPALLASCAVGALVVGVLLVQAEPVPRTFAYQGVLTDDVGNPIAGVHTITMRVYADAGSATALCTEIEVAAVTNGLFRVTVGDGGCTLDPAWFTRTAPVYLAITVDTTDLSPRVPLFPVASAYQAEHAENADRLIVRRGTEEISVGGIYCGSSIAMTGAAGGLTGVKTLCETACSDPAAHLCSPEEVMRSQQLGIDLPAGERYGAGIPFASGTSYYITDCMAWHDGTVNNWAPALRYDASYGDDVFDDTDCASSRPFLCCL